MRAWILVSALAASAIACGESPPPSRDANRGGSAGASATSTGSGATGGTGATGGSGGSSTGTGGFGGASGGNVGGAGGSNGGVAGAAGSDPVDAGGSAGRPVFDASKPDVGFAWPETVPGLKCRAGRYHGTFEGIFASSATFFPLPIPVAGDIDLTLVQSVNGEVLEISNGKLSGTADLVFPFAADLLGKLNCRVSKLDPATALKSGYYVVFGVQFPFEGPFLGDYDKVNAAFVNGSWDVKEPNPLYGGNGSWTATWVGP
jgi:hypothetical protein